MPTEKNHIWYPYTQMKNMKEPYHIIDAEGVYLYTEDSKLIDSASSWWCMIHGYKNPEITEAIKRQADKFCHVMLCNLTHDGALNFSRELADFLPGDLNHVFFSDSGSVSVEVALKMALQYYVNDAVRRETHNERTKVLSLTHSYHGDTFKTMEIGDDEDYHFAFPEKKGVTHINTEIDELENAFRREGEQYYCMIVEPLLQGAGGMRMYDVSFLKRARELCDQYGVLLIFDEVATGFGRTGNRFAADLVLPDIICLGKALTGGYVGHAATVASEKVYQGFYDDDERLALMHGPTFMGNALAMAAGLKSLEIFRRENYMDKIHHIEAVARREIAGYEAEGLREVRAMGGCICFEADNGESLSGFQDFAAKRGVFARNFLNVQYAMVPYIIKDEELIQIIDTMKAWWER
ncbi:adenosylmethionine-8-amino-7-oxononanoate aminotransferase [[Clostridium] aminophilum]|uniref:Adenosylmethionine-8-amino-7-oxononanoate aminotransferase n=1 Tax=[Clostridium] aminophilum TaxID=1526 RepID=A0A1I0HI08_9FIRM|nr:adenosylmethionine--8-amino-7-oxononanoate transaminase [[Clostridium] aminophilum]SET83626.1 adenosylmethionine-8-amino-7-oxononanoate aminotransferase [[Clostridium] aminophilum]